VKAGVTGVIMNHKRKRPKNRRGGCLLCKPHKANGCKHGNPTRQEAKARASEAQQIREIDFASLD